MNNTATNTQTATFGAGCYWNSQRAFTQIPGVLATVVGFMDGIEVVQVEYDPAVISYDALLDAFWSSHDTSVGVGGERSAIFVHSDQQSDQARAAKAKIASGLKPEIQTEIWALSAFSRAPEHDQRYHEKQDM